MACISFRFCLVLGDTSNAATAVIDSCSYPQNAAAQAAWKPMGKTAPVSVAVLDGRKVLRLTCNFDAKIERASWDSALKLDLGSGRGIEFELLCRDASPVSYFSIYFQSGAGWYHGTFFPESSSGWNTIAIDKANMTTEGEPAGWSQIRTIRISAWRGQDKNTEFFLQNLRQVGVLGADAAVAILRCDSAARESAEGRRSVEQYTETVARNLHALDIGCAVLSESDVNPEILERAKIIILPFNPSMPDPVAEELVRYMGRGGKLLAFYSIPGRLRTSLPITGGSHTRAEPPGRFAEIRMKTGLVPGAPPLVSQKSWNINAFAPVDGASRVLAEWHDADGRPTGHAAIIGSTNFILMTHVLLRDDPANQRRLLLALVGSLAPEMWLEAAGSGLRRIGRFSGFDTYQQAVARITSLGGKKEGVTRGLATARDLHAKARRLLDEDKFAESVEQSAAANRALLEAFCRAQSAAPGEFRAFWCHSAFGVQGMDWEEAARRLAENGFTAVLPNMLWGGAAFYPSKVLPVASPVAERGDQVAQCLAACRRHGLQIHVWKVNWNLGHAAPKEFVERLRREGRLQADSNGKEEPWLCPSHPANQKLELESLVELARNYDLDGIHFDYIRYPDAEHCFCAGCRERFQQGTGLVVKAWPRDVLADGALRQGWLDWRRSNITALVKAVSEKVRSIKPRMKISAAVFPNWDNARDTIGQDWKLWCEKGYLDFVCPMDYTTSNSNFANMVRRQIGWAGSVPCYPGIGASASSSQFGVDKVIDQISIARQNRTGGFVVFNYGVAESQELLPLLGLGITAKQ